MGYGLMGYAVDVEGLQRFVGSQDEKTRRMICGRFRGEMQRLDDSFSYAPEPSTRDAIYRIVHGEAKPGAAFKYAYAFKLIVEHFGRHLPNGALYPIRGEYMDAVDGALSAGGVTAISLSGLSYGGFPVELPRPDDFPGTGYLTAAQVVEADDQLRAMADPADPEVLDAVQDLRAWTREARAKGWGIVAFYH